MRNFIAIGLNYSDHAAEGGNPIPKEPVVFNKQPSCICGPNDNTMVPKNSSKLDYECELGIIIGKRARYLSQDKAMDAVAGYCIGNDVSEREFQMEHGQTIAKGKGCETFGPLGPWFVTKDEIKDPQKLAMWTNVNGEKRQRGNTSNMIFDCRHIVWYLLAVLRARAGRRHRHRHARRRRPRPQGGAEISAGRRRGHPRHRRARRAEAEDRAVQGVRLPLPARGEQSVYRSLVPAEAGTQSQACWIPLSAE